MLDTEVRALLIDTQVSSSPSSIPLECIINPIVQHDNKAAISFFEKQGFGHPVKHVYLDLNLKKFEDEQAEAKKPKKPKRRNNSWSSKPPRLRFHLICAILFDNPNSTK